MLLSPLCQLQHLPARENTACLHYHTDSYCYPTVPACPYCRPQFSSLPICPSHPMKHSRRQVPPLYTAGTQRLTGADCSSLHLQIHRMPYHLTCHFYLKHTQRWTYQHNIYSSQPRNCMATTKLLPFHSSTHVLDNTISEAKGTV
jgi:hypothetical protein